jgi:uncharacterized membrane-anchored protein YjiN (DUF445 family)
MFLAIVLVFVAAFRGLFSRPGTYLSDGRMNSTATGSVRPPLDDAARLARLKRMQRIATGLLLLSLAVFLVSWRFESLYPWLGYVRATAEASMVGGLADWFAVTALFRHPLGIPIPHTAIVPNRKDQVGRSMGGFVQRHFLSAEVIGAKLRSSNVAAQLAEWLSNPVNARLVARQAAIALAAGARATRQETIEDLIEQSVARKIARTPVAPLLGRALSLLTDDNRHQELLDEVVRLLARAVSQNRDFIRARIDQETPWWLPEQVDDKIAEKVVRSIDRTLQQIRDDPEHPMRDRFDVALRDFIDRLQHSPDVIARAESIKQELLDKEAVRTFSSNLWDDARTALVRQAEAQEAPALDSIARGLVSFGEAVKQDSELLAKIDNWIVEVAAHLVDRFRDDVAGLISDTVSSWDPEATSRRIELAVGRDLQFIRINGTLVGGLAGLLIYTLTRLF